MTTITGLLSPKPDSIDVIRAAPGHSVWLHEAGGAASICLAFADMDALREFAAALVAYCDGVAS